MKKIKEFNSETEAQIFSGYLKSHGVENRIEGQREYTTLLLGGTGGHYRVMVADEDLPAAIKLLNRTHTDTSSEPLKDSPNRLLKKAILHAFFAILILPGVFHVTSIMKAREYWREEPNQSRKLFWIGVLILLYIGGFVVMLRAFELTAEMTSDLLKQMRSLQEIDNM